MDGIFEIVVAIVFIVASIYSEVKKRIPSQPDSDLGDLGSIDDFFKNQGTALPPPGNPPSPFEIRQEPVRRRTVESDATAWESSASAGEEDVASNWGAPATFHEAEEAERAPVAKKKPKKRRPERKSGHEHVSPHPVDHPDWGTNFDQMESLDGRVNLEELGGEGVSLIGPRSPAVPITMSQQAAGRRWSRQDVCRALILSMVLEPYNINRALNRLPGNRDR